MCVEKLAPNTLKDVLNYLCEIAILKMTSGNKSINLSRKRSMVNAFIEYELAVDIEEL